MRAYDVSGHDFLFREAASRARDYNSRLSVLIETLSRSCGAMSQRPTPSFVFVGDEDLLLSHHDAVRS